MRWVGIFLSVTWLASAEPGKVSRSTSLSLSNREKNPVVTLLTGRFFEARVKAFVTENQRVRIRVEIENRAGSAAYFSLHGAIFDRSGELLGGGGCNDVDHQKRKGQNTTVQWDVLMVPSDQKKLSSLQVVLYEDTTFVGRR